MRGKACSIEFMRKFARLADDGLTTAELCDLYCMEEREIYYLLAALKTQRKLEVHICAPVPLQPSHYREIARAPEEAQPVIAQQAAKEKWTVKKVRLAVQEAMAATIPQVSEVSEPSANGHLCRLVHGDIRDTGKWVTAGSVDAIITDPPYSREFLPLYGVLAETAATLLKPGGLALVMIGQSYLPEILRLMTPRLTYHWILAYLTPGQSPHIWQRKVNTFWKPVLCFTKGPYSSDWISDVVTSRANDKRFHEWGQSESGMAELVERFTKPDDLILDPFLGGGTTAVVAQRLGRNFIGIDSDIMAIATAQHRLAGDEKHFVGVRGTVSDSAGKPHVAYNGGKIVKFPESRHWGNCPNEPPNSAKNESVYDKDGNLIYASGYVDDLNDEDLPF